MQVELYKKQIEKEGKTYTNYWVKCGSTLVAVRPSFTKDKDGKPYTGDIKLLNAFSDELPQNK